jgi:hypothetical protein
LNIKRGVIIHRIFRGVNVSIRTGSRITTGYMAGLVVAILNESLHKSVIESFDDVNHHRGVEVV